MMARMCTTRDIGAITRAIYLCPGIGWRFWYSVVCAGYNGTGMVFTSSGTPSGLFRIPDISLWCLQLILSIIMIICLGSFGGVLLCGEI
ncbi:hypothetical protein QR685DRAFT_62006 [Neurospora intermedia]|uniref:Uncharacterized protein n=1 Tax=Neurospora intermedia TaxID=5142 RepID=A0ABR3DT93_NEUIN